MARLTEHIRVCHFNPRVFCVSVYGYDTVDSLELAHITLYQSKATGQRDVFSPFLDTVDLLNFKGVYISMYIAYICISIFLK